MRNLWTAPIGSFQGIPFQLPIRFVSVFPSQNRYKEDREREREREKEREINRERERKKKEREELTDEEKYF